MTDYKFSVIIPAYNCAGTIKNAVDSVLSQSYDNFELIIVNDGSTDSTTDVLNEISISDGRVKTFYQKNSGPAEARNFGIENSTGDYILFLDSDDCFNSGAFERINGYLNGNKTQMLIFGFSQIFTDSGKRKDYRFDSMYAEKISDIGARFGKLYRSDVLNQVWNKAFFRKMLIDNNIVFPDLKYGEDRLFCAQCLKCANGIKIADDILYDYIIDSSLSLISGWYDKKFYACNEIYKEFSSLSDICEPSGDKRDIKYMYMKSVLSCLTVLYSKKCKKSNAEKQSDNKKIISSDEISSVLDIKFDKVSDEIIRKILISKNVFLSSLLAKTTVFAQENMTSLFLKLKS